MLPTPGQAVAQPTGEQLCRKEPVGPGIFQVEQDPALFLCGKENQQPPGLH